MIPDIRQQEGYEELLEKLVTKFPLEDLVRPFKPEELLPFLPVEALRALSEDYVRTLPPDVQQAIRERLAR